MPRIDAQVFVVFFDVGRLTGVILGGCYSDKTPAPAGLDAIIGGKSFANHVHPAGTPNTGKPV